MSQSREVQQGSILITVAILIVVLAGLGLAFISLTYHRFEVARIGIENDRAYQVAESGMDLAVAEIKLELDASNDGIGFVSGDMAGGYVTVTVDPPFNGEGTYVLRAIGYYGRRARGLEVIVGARRLGFGHFGLFATGSISGNGEVLVDSYDSRMGSYATQATNVTPEGITYASSNGDIGSNGDIQLVGTNSIFGDAIPGPEGTLYTGSGSTITGSTTSSESAMIYEEPAYAPPIATQPPMRIQNGTVNLGSGVYRPRSLAITGTLVLSGDVEIFIDQDFSITGGGQIVLAPDARVVLRHGNSGSVHIGGNGIVNASEDPSRFTIYDSNTTDSITYAGTSEFFGSIYAPRTEFLIQGDAEFYGSVIVGSATLGGSVKFHRDESLGSAMNDQLQVLIVREFSPIDI